MHKLLLLVVGVSCAPQRGQQQQRPGPYGPQAAPARYTNQAPVYRDEMNKNYPREETPEGSSCSSHPGRQGLGWDTWQGQLGAHKVPVVAVADPFEGHTKLQPQVRGACAWL